jgi:hypothetical protein
MIRVYEINRDKPGINRGQTGPTPVSKARKMGTSRLSLQFSPPAFSLKQLDSIPVIAEY